MNQSTSSLRRLACALPLVLLAVACASPSDEDGNGPSTDTPPEQVDQTKQELRLGIDRNCPAYMFWCAVQGMCISTDSVCYDPDKPAPVLLMR